MDYPSFLLTIDIGNTSTSCAIFDVKNIVYRNRLITPDEITDEFLKNLLKSDFISRIGDVVCASVVPYVDRSLERSIKNLLQKKVLFVDHKTDTGIKIKIDKPEELGADRIADSVGGLHFFTPPFIVIDSGTATTFDIVNKDYEYIGGSIFSGIELSIRSLANNTAKLDRINFKIPKSIIGSNTESSIRSGIYYSYIGGLGYMIDECKKEVGADAKVCATGGLTRYFKGKIKSIDMFEPDLIFYGLRMIYNRVTDRKHW